jgi:hypothetical protein
MLESIRCRLSGGNQILAISSQSDVGYQKPIRCWVSGTNQVPIRFQEHQFSPQCLLYLGYFLFHLRFTIQIHWSHKAMDLLRWPGEVKCVRYRMYRGYTGYLLVAGYRLYSARIPTGTGVLLLYGAHPVCECGAVLHSRTCLQGWIYSRLAPLW